MAHGFISAAIHLNESLRNELSCCIHRGLLERPIVLPPPCTHRICTECMEEYLKANHTQQITCPMCRKSHAVPPTWSSDWFDRVGNSFTTELASSESEISKRVTDFVEHSYIQFGSISQKIKITSVEQLYNPALKEKFEKCKSQLKRHEVVTLLHGTDRRAALSISANGFSIPSSFDRNQNNGAEGELKFGKAIYFAHAKKASEYGKNIFVLTDCVLGRTQIKNASELKLTPDIVHKRGYDTIYYNNLEEGPINQEWAIYRSEQCFPLCIIQYELLGENSATEELMITRIQNMNLATPNYELLKSALFGTDNQCKAVFKKIGDGGSAGLPQASMTMRNLLTIIKANEMEVLFGRSNETIRILLLRALWQTGRCDKALQQVVYQNIGLRLLIASLYSSYADVSWRACGVLTNLAAHVPDARRFLVQQDILNQLMAILQRAVRFDDKICTITVLNLFADMATTEYTVMKAKTNILNYLNENILDHKDEDIQESGNRLFCNIINKGNVFPDWQKQGYQAAVAAPSMEPATSETMRKLHNDKR